MYKRRFENIRRIAKKVTSSLNIGDILEMIRDEAKVSLPKAEEACLLLFDPEAPHYTRPLHCSIHKERINCQLCKRGRGTIQSALSHPTSKTSSSRGKKTSAPSCEESAASTGELAIPIVQDDQPLAVLNVIAREGEQFNLQDTVLLEDLADLATNVIINSRTHSKMAQEKLTVDRILEHLRPFVPETVQRIVEKNPQAPSLGRQDIEVSILFLDVAGYTRISETLTREMVTFIIEKYFSSFMDIIYTHGGDINETAGDGLMVIFQGPEKDNALNAAHASLKIRDRTEEINAELAGRFDPIQVNMGINSGMASVGMNRFHGAAGTRMTFTAMGPTTNLAARIAKAAIAGDILVGPDTARRIEKEIPLYDRGIMHFMNIAEGIPVKSLVRPG